MKATGSINRNEFHGGATKESRNVNYKEENDEEEENYLAEELFLTQYHQPHPFEPDEHQLNYPFAISFTNKQQYDIMEQFLESFIFSNKI